MRGRYGLADRMNRIGLWLARAAFRIACIVATIASWLVTVAATVATLAADRVHELIASNSLVMDPAQPQHQEHTEPDPDVIDGAVLAVHVHDTPHERSTT